MNLAFRLRPEILDDFVGQEHLIGKDKFINRMLKNNALISLILWGPPGVGKTTLAFLIAKELNANFYEFSAVTAGKDDLKKIIESAKNYSNKANASQIKNKQDTKLINAFQNNEQNKTVLFIDEIHRWNKAQQDALLPYVEYGLIILIGATTENPSFAINSALLSRCKILVLKSLGLENLQTLIKRALMDNKKGLGKYKKEINKNAEELLIRLAGGDARIMLNALELATIQYKTNPIDINIIADVFQTKSTNLYDKNGEEHYDTISAFIKSMRGSDINASLYYLARMIESGEDPIFIARRMIIFASEDIGLADRGALIQANAGFEAVHKIGLPEASLILAQICAYLTLAKKSRATTNALTLATNAVKTFPNEPIPYHLRNAPTKLMEELNYAKGYNWSEDYVGPTENQSFLPEKIKNKKFYNP